MSIKENIDVDAGIAYQGLGAYAAASNIATAQAFEAGYAAALEMGLEGTVATQYANQAAEGAGLAGAETVGSWLPYVAMGLSAYNLVTNPSQQSAWYTALTGFSIIPGAAPFALGMGLLSGGIGYMKGQSAKHAKHYIHWHTPKLEVIGQDEEGWTYLYDTNFEFSSGGWHGEESASRRARQRGFILRYNPETNELQKTDMFYDSGRKDRSGSDVFQMTPEQAAAWIAGEDPGLTKEHWYKLDNKNQGCDGEVRERHRAGGANNYYCVTSYSITPESDYFPQTKWETIDLTYNWDESDRRDPVITDPSAFQAEIYNNVLLPQGYVDTPSAETGWSIVMMGGQEYFMDSRGLLADPETGYLLGAADQETGQAIDFSGPRGKSRIRKSSGEIQPGSITYLGTIDNWDQVQPIPSTDESPTPTTEPSTPITEIPTADTPVAHITLPGQPSGLLLTPETSEPEPSPFATLGTWDPTTNMPAPATPQSMPNTTPLPESTVSPLADTSGGLLSQTSTPPVANITLPQRSLSGFAGLLSEDTRQTEPSPFTTPGTWDPTIPVPPVANITLPGRQR